MALRPDILFHDFHVPFDGSTILCAHRKAAANDVDGVDLVFFHPEGMAALFGVGLQFGVVEIRKNVGGSDGATVREVGEQEWREVWTSTHNQYAPLLVEMASDSTESHHGNSKREEAHVQQDKLECSIADFRTHILEQHWPSAAAGHLIQRLESEKKQQQSGIANRAGSAMIVFLPDCSSTASAVESAPTRSSGWRKYWFSRSSSNSSNSSNVTQDEQDPSSEDDSDSETATPVPPARTTMSKLRRRASQSATQFKKELQSCAIHPCANITFSTRDRFAVALEGRFLLTSATTVGPRIGHDNFYMSFDGASTNAAQLDSAPLLGSMHSMTMPGRHDEPKWSFVGGQQVWEPCGLPDSEKMDKSSSAGQGVMANLVLSDESLCNRLAVRATYIADDQDSRQTNPDNHGLTVSCAGDYTVVFQGCRIYKLKMQRTVQIATAASDNNCKSSRRKGKTKTKRKKPSVQLRQGLVRKVWINHSFADHVEKRVTCWPPCAVQSLEGAAQGGHGRAGGTGPGVRQHEAMRSFATRTKQKALKYIANQGEVANKLITTTHSTHSMLVLPVLDLIL